MKSKLPLIVILGATGTGKTKLSLQLAQKYNGEIISADSMQLYKGLDISTAKATKTERMLVPHHFIDILSPSQIYTVLDFRNQAIPLINDLFSKNKLPIVVGGTNYYIESLLWKVLIEDIGRSKGTYFEPGKGLDYLLHLSNQELHQKLQSIDPDMAKRLHPNNRRKVLRSLEVAEKMGTLHSEIIKKQKNEQGGSSSGGPLRFKNAIILWMQCEQKMLDERLNKRVDSMLEEGLIEELLNFHRLYNKERISMNQEPDYTRGVFQAIGFKEFHEYLILDENEKNKETGKKLLEQGIQELKRVTRRYARKQNKWINNRFLGRSDREVPPVYGLDTSDMTMWQQAVQLPAENVIDSFINGVEPNQKSLPRKASLSTSNAEDDTYFCEVCQRVFVGKYQWNIHLGSQKHRRILHRKRKRESSESQL